MGKVADLEQQQTSSCWQVLSIMETSDSTL